MKELTYPKNIKLEEFGIEVRPYLYLDEKKQIVEKMLELDNPLDRELCMWSIIFQICCGIDEGADYDLLCATGVKDKVYNIFYDDIQEIENAIVEAESMTRLVAAFLADMTGLMDKMAHKIPTGAKLEKLFDKVANVVGKQDGDIQ